MRPPQPPREAMRTSRAFLGSLSAAHQTYRLYPDGHPNRAEVVRDLHARARSLATASRGDAVVFCTRHSFYLGPSLLSRESLSLNRLIEAFEAIGLEAVEILTSCTEADIDGFARTLVGERPMGESLGGVMLNRVRPELDPEDNDLQGLLNLLRSYAIGLDVLRETAEKVVAGEDTDLDATRRVVSGLATQVARDPSQALLVSAVKSYDEYTYYHMMNVCILSIALGHSLGLRQDQVATLGLGALLHDVGKMRVPREVLNHVGPLDQEQWRLIQRHPVEGAGLILLNDQDLIDPAAAIILEHHAAFDLSGYPKLSGRPRPSLPARLVSVADCYDAVTAKRSYRNAEEPREALAILQSGVGKGFDPVVVRTFVRLLGLFPVGSLVMLSSGEVAVVLRNHDELFARPTVRLVLDASGTPCAPEERDLSALARDGSYVWSVERSMDPTELGLDMLSVILQGEPEDEVESEGGLVHEPSFGEAPPPGYVDTHEHPGEGAAASRLDSEVSAPFGA